MKILHINGTAYGGTTNFIIDLHEKLLDQKIESFVYLPKKRNINNSLHPNSIFFKIQSIYKIITKKIINKLFFHNDQTFTLGIFKSYEIEKIIKEIKPDIINLHWIGNEFLSLNEIKKFNVPIVWTLHDMWVFLPIDHYLNKKIQTIGFPFKIISDYLYKFFLNKKKDFSKKKIKFIPTSDWMKKEITNSKLFKDYQISKVPCAIDFQKWYPEEKRLSRNMLSLDEKKKKILFISMGGNNPRKGFDLLLESIEKIESDYELIVAGDQFPKSLKKKNIKFFDNPKDLVTRRLLYSASDVLAVPSREEAFGLVALEASACNTPSVIFENTGLSGTVIHKKNGYIAKKDDLNDYANGILWVFNQTKNNDLAFANCREMVKEKFDINLIAKDYVRIYEDLLAES